MEAQTNKPKWLTQLPSREDYFVATGEVEFGGDYVDTGYFNDEQYEQHTSEYYNRHYWHHFDQLKQQDVVEHLDLNSAIKITLLSCHVIRSYPANQFQSYDELWTELKKQQKQIRLIKYHH